MTKTQFISAIAKGAGVTIEQAKSVLDSLAKVTTANLKTDGKVVIPGIARLKTTKKAATVDRPGINPFTKQPTTIKGKPASLKVKAAPEKSLKDALAT
jgi:nucleoid DNA-binding protein